MKYLISFAILFFLGSCLSEGSRLSTLVQYELNSLQNAEQQLAYYKAIFEVDQNQKLSKNHIPQKLGLQVEMEEYTFFTHHQMNVERIRQILRKEGFPKDSFYAEQAALSIWVVLHHDYDEANTAEFLYPMHKGHQNGQLNTTNYLWYLRRRYENKSQQSWTLPTRLNETIERAETKKLEKVLFELYNI